MNSRKSTKYPGVQARESADRRYNGRPDICYTIDYRDATGKRIRKDIGWASQGFTAAYASAIRAKLVHAARTAQTLGEFAPPIKPPCPTLAEAWEKYLHDWLMAERKNYASDISLIKHLGGFMNMPLEKITAYELDKLMGDMRAQGFAPQTIRHAIGLVRRIMLRMEKWGLYSGPMPFRNIVLPKLNNQRVRFLSPAEARVLLAELKKRSIQVWLMALVSLHCGLRFGEIARLRREHIDFENMTIYIAESKSGKARHAVMTQEVARAIQDFAPAARSELLFPTKSGGIMTDISETFFRAVNDLGFNDGITDRRQKVVFHTLRHTYASWLAKSGQGQLIIADRLGHHSLQMTMRYTHLMDESRKASAEAISKFFHGDSPDRQ